MIHFYIDVIRIFVAIETQPGKYLLKQNRANDINEESRAAKKRKKESQKRLSSVVQFVNTE